ncbi:hypothetical protein FHS18_004560 [Paenibacillus phyllosphaerae]|uniref:Uncharacterized protein n=1 Tax=Paenibacillus phyllosphaerae TaxID=274593 RepID=A0A7W5B109_9BACL|nr:hypothetical protein [Paenibacillus phyllosphaerae]MBB3112459.1 hypothetical protein [Paenibacillus phyllosphaerae]
MKKSKKTLFSSLVLSVAALALALPASAADQNYQLWNPANNAVSHASSSVEGPAVVTGSGGNYTVQIKLKNSGTYMGITLPASYPSLNVDVDGASAGGDGDYEVSATRVDSGGYTTFTFSGLSDNTLNVPIELSTSVLGIHSSTYELVIDWN